MRGYILICALFVAAAVEAKPKDASTTSVKEKVDTVMSAVNEHCSARRKRQVGPSSEDKVRRLILNVVKDCLEDKDGGGKPTPHPETTPHPEPTTSHSLPYGPCSSPNTVNLNEAWRMDNKGSDIQPIDGDYNCDAPLFDNTTWFRITGEAGNRIRDTCSPPYSCGSHGGIWTNASMPMNVGEVMKVPLYGSWAGNCDWYPWQVELPLTVQRCSPDGDFVYLVDGLTGCYHSVCGMDG